MNWDLGTIVATVTLATLPGCEAPAPVEVVTQETVTMEGRDVVWQTEQPTLGAVRYGTSPGVRDAVAYPACAMRGDKTYSTRHRVSLATVPAGETIHLEVLDRAMDRRVVESRTYAFTMTASPPPAPFLEWTMIDVGFGDAHLLTMPTTGLEILIDAGERRDWPNVDRYLKEKGVQCLDVVLATHVHLDHVGGLLGEEWIEDDGVLGAYEVGVLLDGPSKSAYRSAYEELMRLVQARGIDVQIVHVGDTHVTNPALAWDPTVSVAVLNAGDGRLAGGTYESDWINNDSIMLKITYGDVDMILGGDAEAPAERRVVATFPSLQAELLKIHHHGVADASDPLFLDAVNPRVGLVPICTYESYDGTLPSTEVLGRLTARAVDVYASDRAETMGITLHGDAGYHVTVVTDGASYEVRVHASRSAHYPGDRFAAGTQEGTS